VTIFLNNLWKVVTGIGNILLCTLCISYPVLARDQPDYSNLFLGFSAKSLDYDYYRSVDDMKPAGTMTSDVSLFPVFRVQLPYQMTGKSQWGWYTELEAKPFQLSKQLVADQIVALDTEVSGWYWHITPIGFYRWQLSKNTEVFHILQGIGLGLGYQDVSGTMMLTEDLSNEVVHIDSRGLDLSVSVITEFQYQFWLVRIYAGGLILDQQGTNNSVFDMSLELAYRIPLEDLF